MSKVEIVILNNEDLYEQSSYFFKQALLGKVYHILAGNDFFITRLQEKAIRLPVCKFKYSSAPLHEALSVVSNVVAKVTSEINEKTISRILIFVPKDFFLTDTFYFCAAVETSNA